MSSHTHERLEWVDVSKGIGILLVVIGHCVTFGGFVHNWIFSFHMPMFFMLSGLFIRKENIYQFTKKKIKSLLIPYVVFSFIGFILTLIIPIWREGFNFLGILQDIYLACPENANNSSVWFLVCLFITEVAFQFILRIKNEKIKYVIVLVITAVGFAFSRIITKFSFLPFGRLPWSLDVALVAILFLAIAYEGKKYLLTALEKFRNQKIVIRMLMVAILVLISVGIVVLNHRTNLHGMTYNNPILYVVGAFAGFAIIVTISVLVSNVLVIKDILGWVGRNSLVILGIQSVLIRMYITVINVITGSEYKMYFLPTKEVISSSIYVIIISIIITWMYRKIYPVKNNKCLDIVYKKVC